MKLNQLQNQKDNKLNQQLINHHQRYLKQNQLLENIQKNNNLLPQLPQLPQQL